MLIILLLGAIVALSIWVFMLLYSEDTRIGKLRVKAEAYEEALIHVNHIASKHCVACRVQFDYATAALNKYRS